MKVLAADIGGTNTNLAIIETQSLRVLREQHVSTKSIKHFSEFIKDFIADEVEHGCFAIAGPVKKVKGRNTAEMTNTKLIISETELEKSTLKRALIINDFEATGFATNVLKAKDVSVIRKGPNTHGPRVLVGAGTGLGKATLLFDTAANAYIPLASEFGHSDVPVFSEQELHLLQFIQDKEKVKSVTYEHVLSGSGLERLYEYFAHKHLAAEYVSQQKDAHARDAVKQFKKFYARFCKNTVLDALAEKIFIAGGIAAKFPHWFDKEFIHELERHHNDVHKKILQNVGITVITNYDISLRGAAQALEVSQ